MLRHILRYAGLLCLTAVFVASGLQKVSTPTVEATILSRSALPTLLASVNIKLSSKDYIILARAIGFFYMAFPLFILLGVGRSFFAAMLALLSLLLSLVYYVDKNNLTYIPTKNIRPFLKSLGIVGGLLFVAGTGQRSKRYYQALSAEERAKKHD